MFLRHEACPNCRQIGKDRKGNNLGRYSDGSAFCFACGYVERKTSFQLSKKKELSIPHIWDTISAENTHYLQQYLTNEEIYQYFKGCKYGHIFTHVNPDGSLFWEARAVNPKKVISGGFKPFLTFGGGEILFLVEDLVSAIVVARRGMSMPLFGSHLSNDKIPQICKIAKEVVVWLDPDKRKEALLLCNRLSILIPTRCVFTPYDPKEKDIRHDRN